MGWLFLRHPSTDPFQKNENILKKIISIIPLKVLLSFMIDSLPTFMLTMLRLCLYVHIDIPAHKPLWNQNLKKTEYCGESPLTSTTKPGLLPMPGSRLSPICLWHCMGVVEAQIYCQLSALFLGQLSCQFPLYSTLQILKWFKVCLVEWLKPGIVIYGVLSEETEGHQIAKQRAKSKALWASITPTSDPLMIINAMPYHASEKGKVILK